MVGIVICLAIIALAEVAGVYFQFRNTLNELIVGQNSVIQILIGEHKGLSVMGLQAEESVGPRIIALFLQ